MEKEDFFFLLNCREIVPEDLTLGEATPLPQLARED